MHKTYYFWVQGAVTSSNVHLLFQITNGSNWFSKSFCFDVFRWNSNIFSQWPFLRIKRKKANKRRKSPFVGGFLWGVSWYMRRVEAATSTLAHFTRVIPFEEALNEMRRRSLNSHNGSVLLREIWLTPQIIDCIVIKNIGGLTEWSADNF